MKKIVAVSSFLSRNLTLVIIFTTLIALVIPEIFLYQIFYWLSSCSEQVCL